MAEAKETPFATITIRLYKNSREVDIKGFKKITERVLEDLPRFIREKLFVLRATAARAQRALEREKEAEARVSSEPEDSSTEEEKSLPLPSSVEEIQAAVTKEV